MMLVPQGPILPTEVRMIAINVYRKYVSVHKEKDEPRTSVVFKIQISHEMVINRKQRTIKKLAWHTKQLNQFHFF